MVKKHHLTTGTKIINEDKIEDDLKKIIDD